MKLLALFRWVCMMLISGIGYGVITILLLIASIWVDINLVFIACTLVFTSWVMFTLLYPFRNTFIRRLKPFWYYFDDEDQFGFDVSWFMNGRKRNFFTAYKWAAIRNPMWNLQASLVVKQGNNRVVSVKGLLTQYGKDVSYYKMAVLKWVDKNGKNVGNKGDYLSLKHSIIGSMFLWYKKGGRLYWRYSCVGEIGKWWIEFQVGTTDDNVVNEKLQRGRYTWRLKRYKHVKMYEHQ